MSPRKKTKTKVDFSPPPVMGAPKKYDPKTFPKTARFLAQRGATLAEIADCFGVCTRTINRWQIEYPELQQAIDSGGGDMFNPRVERSLAERAMGYSVDVEECFVVDGEVVKQTVRKHYPPDTTAGIYWTKNRDPERWRDVQRHEIAPLQSSTDLRRALVLEFKDLIDKGLLKLPGARSERKMKEINPKDVSRETS